MECELSCGLCYGEWHKHFKCRVHCMPVCQSDQYLRVQCAKQMHFQLCSRVSANLVCMCGVRLRHLQGEYWKLCMWSVCSQHLSAEPCHVILYLCALEWLCHCQQHILCLQCGLCVVCIALDSLFMCGLCSGAVWHVRHILYAVPPRYLQRSECILSMQCVSYGNVLHFEWRRWSQCMLSVWCW